MPRQPPVNPSPVGQSVVVDGGDCTEAGSDTRLGD
jgi:hypothetical protein